MVLLYLPKGIDGETDLSNDAFGQLADFPSSPCFL
jgi:hypothetical protein